jgi:SAM-dependent methyltransferase
LAAQIDATAFRAKQQADWNIAANGWRKWAETIDVQTGHISRRLVELAGVEPGFRVLDVAAGYGEPTLTAAQVAGPDGTVVATDISAQMLAFGRERAEAAGLDNVEFMEADAASLDFPHESFDAAVSRWGIIFEPDGEGAAARVRGFLKPGARMAISSWGAPPEVPFLSIPMTTVMQKLDAPPPPPGTPGPMSRPTPEAIGGLLEGGGFSNVEVERAEVVVDFDSADEFTVYIQEMAAPIAALVAAAPPEVQEETWAAVSSAFAEHAGADGRVSLPNAVLLASGTA